ncbi:hypothetical protein QL093DRAFT_2629463 [Fusarium oxysporum]|nr:hypothetical protein QL093DRAFT_2629463 [Fusarium oxysporum]
MYLSPVKPSSMDESLGSEITVSTTPPLVALRRLPKEYIQLLESNSSSITSRLSLWELQELEGLNEGHHLVTNNGMIPELLDPRDRRRASRATSIGDEGVLNGDIDNLVCTPAGTLLYKRCCLQSYLHLARNDVAAQEVEKQMFYPFSMLHDTGSLTVETVLPSVKEVFAAGNVYPFTNTAIETLALDKKLRRTWELVGGALSHQPAL